jgi:hypothetical protein
MTSYTSVLSVWLPSYARPTKLPKILGTLQCATRVSPLMQALSFSPQEIPSKHNATLGYMVKPATSPLLTTSSGVIYGETCASKAPPIEFVNQWLAQYGCGQDVPNKYVCMDLGGELSSCLEIVGLCKKAGYKIETTAAQSSNQNRPGERLHQTIANALQSMLVRAGLPAKFWPNAFCHYLQIYNLIPNAGAQQSTYEICTGNIPDLSWLCTFGCHV